MIHDPLMADAAVNLLLLLDRYELKFRGLVDQDMDAAAYDRVADTLDAMRPYKAALLPHMAGATVRFTIAHSEVVSMLFTVKLDVLSGSHETAGDADLAEVWRTHRDAMASLREACGRFLSGPANPA